MFFNSPGFQPLVLYSIPREGVHGTIDYMLETLSIPLTIQSALLGVNLEQLISAIGVLGILGIIFAESGLLVGFFLPGDSLLFTAGFLVSISVLKIDINLLVFLLFLAAVLGDNVGYAFGRRVGHKIFRRPNSIIFRKENIEHAEAFYEKHGGKTIIMARFIPVVRTFAPIVAGVGKMKYTTFLSYNIIGGLLWSAGLTYLGYFLGSWFTSIGLDIDTVILPIAALIIIISILPPAIHILKNKKQREAIFAATKKQLRTLFRRK